MQTVSANLRRYIEEKERNRMRSVDYAVYSDAGFSSGQIDALLELLDRKQVHWLFLNPQTGLFEMVVDNVILSSFRACPAYGITAFVEGVNTRGRDWNLEFGLVFHDAMEDYYTNFRKPDFNLEQFVKRQGENWMSKNMEMFSTHPGYIALGGLLGYGGLLVQYVQRFGPENERLRVLGSEISFGHNKEVHVGDIQNWLSLYLSGRIDVLVDDGTSICPLDHKTKTSFKRDVTLEYELDEGPTGYIYAVNKILPQIVDPALLKRNANKIIMNFILKSLPKEGDRFKRIGILKTQEQLIKYEQRMLNSAGEIFRTVLNYACGSDPVRDTSKCSNWYMHDCPFLPIHRQNSKDNEDQIIKGFYDVKAIWNTEKVKENNNGN